jgi:large subunit ribosomal protein L13
MLREPASTLFGPRGRVRAFWTAASDRLAGRAPAPPRSPMKTTRFRAQDVEERWVLYDASQHVLGRMAADIAMRLMGKDTPQYTREELSGTHVVVINAKKAVFTGKKADVKYYPKFSGYPGGRYEHTLDMLKAARPHDIVKEAVRRMLPKSTLGRKMITRLKVYGEGEHPHTAQQPVLVEKLIR